MVAVVDVGDDAERGSGGDERHDDSDNRPCRFTLP